MFEGMTASGSSASPSSPRVSLRVLLGPSPNDEITDTGVRGGCGEVVPRVGLTRPVPIGVDNIPEEAEVNGGDDDGDDGATAAAGPAVWCCLSWRAKRSRWRHTAV